VDGLTGLPRRRRRVVAISAVLVLVGTVAGCSKTTAVTATTKPGTLDKSAVHGPASPTTKGAPESGSSPPTDPSSATLSAPSWSLITEPNDGMQPLYSLMASAHDTLDMTMYELADPATIAILDADARRGVLVRVLLDRDYSGYSINEPDFSQLASNGVQVRWAPTGTIFHQKTITIDDRTSVIMTLNLTSEYYSTTRDFAVVTTDPPDVAAIEQVFDSDWTNSGAPATGPTGQNLMWSPGAEAGIVSVIDSAHHSLLVENEEMDDPAVTSAFESAAGRGVDVDLVMTYSSSWVDAFDDLTSAGVHVRTYAPDASLYIHAKVMVADDTTMFLGSQNFSASSLDDNRELGIITSDASLVTPVDQTVASDFAGATAFTPPLSASTTLTPTSPSGTTSPATPQHSGALCQASATSAHDGYSGDYDVDITSNQPFTEATASDSTDKWSDETNGSGGVVIRLYDTSPGESITVTVGGATCSTTA
jgi:cardiolipin synthase